MLIDHDQIVLIDTGLAGSAPPILRSIRKLGFALSDLKTILITHSDGDHSGSITELKAATGAKIYASPIEADAIRKGVMSRPLTPKPGQKTAYRLLGSFMHMRQQPVHQILIGGDRFSNLGGLETLETPGHTPGHLSYFLKDEGICFAGDSIWKQGTKLLPFRTTSNTWNTDLAAQSFSQQMNLKPKMIAAGHFYTTSHFCMELP